MARDKVGIISRNIKHQLYFIKKYYSFNIKCLKSQGLAISMIDGKYYHGGLTDRLKGIISIYAYSKCIGVPFRVNFIYPFKLQDYLCPNLYDWIIDVKDINYNVLNSSPVMLFSELSGRRMFRLNKKREHHFYLNRDILPAINGFYKKHYTFSGLFNELFKPAPILQKVIDAQTRIIGDDYCAIVFRFQQLLNDFKEGNFEVLSEEKREDLISRSVVSLKYISEKSNYKKFLVTSDSHTFLDRIKHIPGIYILPGRVSHMEFPSGNEDTNVNLKSFLDLFMIARSKKVYSILIEGYNMYPTEFPKYAAKIGNIPFERIVMK